jgi:hypothetical protein
MMRQLQVGIWNAMHSSAAALGLGITSYRQSDTRRSAMNAARQAKAGREMLLTPVEAVQLISSVRETAKLGGAMAEVGVFRGASARLIFQTDPNRPLHLFDTFEGLPEPSEQDTEFRLGKFSKGQFACALDEVKAYVGESPNIQFHQGFFPATAEPVKEQRFSFVHSDVDLYSSSASVLEFFYPRMLPGAIYITHDFSSCHGPHKALTEFLSSRPEPVIELPGDQGMFVKI